MDRIDDFPQADDRHRKTYLFLKLDHFTYLACTAVNQTVRQRCPSIGSKSWSYLPGRQTLAVKISIRFQPCGHVGSIRREFSMIEFSPKYRL
jgi:hypothetical protein